MEEGHDELVVILTITVAGLPQDPFPPKAGTLIWIIAEDHQEFKWNEP
jgi:hypothetical protein